MALYESQGQPEKVAKAHVFLANSKLHIGKFDTAEHHARIGLALCREVGNQRSAGLALWTLAMLSIITAEIDRAESLLQESLAIFRNIEGAAELGWVFSLYAEVTRQQGKPAKAKKYIREALLRASSVLGLITIQTCILSYMLLQADERRSEWAVEIGALLEKHPFTGASPAAQIFYVDRLDEIKAAMPPDAVAEAEARGRARDLRETAVEIMAELQDFQLVK